MILLSKNYDQQECLFNFLINAKCFSVHPRTKLDVGYRLSRSGLAVAYGQKVQFQGPIVSNINYINGSNTITLTFAARNPIEIRNSIGFEVSILFVFSY